MFEIFMQVIKYVYSIIIQQRIGAEDEIRTRNILLGRQELYR
jgi:hypothetical protein